MGMYGALIRQYLDIAPGRLDPSTWEKVIVGVEGYPKYANPIWNMYTYVEDVDFSEPEQVIRYRDFDVVLMIDSLEHLPKATGLWMLSELLRHNKEVIVSVPAALHYLMQGPVHGNALEEHKAVWKEEDFTAFNTTVLHKGDCLIVALRKC
jgi:hypothetical protein